MLRLDYWIWLGVTAAVHWTLPARHRVLFLACACLGYLGWVQPWLTGSFLAGTWLVHRVLRRLGRDQAGTLGRTLVVGLAVLLAAWKFLPTAGIGLSFRETSAYGLAPLGIS